MYPYFSMFCMFLLCVSSYLEQLILYFEELNMETFEHIKHNNIHYIDPDILSSINASPDQLWDQFLFDEF